jgi:prophage regulatory protein
MVCDIWRMPRVSAASGYSPSTIYLRIQQGLWPRGVSLGPRSVGWPAREVTRMNQARVAGLTDTAIQALVRSIESARSSSFSRYDPNANPRLVAARAAYYRGVKENKLRAPRARRGEANGPSLKIDAPSAGGVATATPRGRRSRA